MGKSKKGKKAVASPRATKKPTLKQFRSEVKKLKEAGITKTDLRKVKPSSYWTKKLKEFRGVINGKQVAVKISPKQAKKAKRQHQGKVVGSFAVFPNIPGQKIQKSKSAPLGFKIVYPNGVTAIKLPPKRKRETLKQFADRIRAYGAGQPGTSVSFAIHGNRTRMTFSDFGQAAQYIQDAYSDDDDGGSAFDDFQLYSMDDDFYA